MTSARGIPWTSSEWSPATSFALAAGNANPQGIADPPAGGIRGMRAENPFVGRLSLGPVFATLKRPDRDVAVGAWSDGDLTDLAIETVLSRTRRGRGSKPR